MSEIIERGAEAMRTKRRELINQPLDRIWPDLMRAAMEAMRDATPVSFVQDIEITIWNRKIDDALQVESV